MNRLRGCLNDLVRIMALPTLGMGGEPSRIVSTLLDALVGTLPFSFAFVELNDPEGGPSIEMARVAETTEGSPGAHEIGEALKAALGDAPSKWPLSARVSIGKAEFSISTTGLGLQGEFGVLAGGYRNDELPRESEALLLGIAANQAAIRLQQVRTRKPATAEDELERRERESWRIIDNIPGPVALLTKTGEVDMANRHLLEYFGATIEETRQWGTNGMVHPEDLPREIERFTQSIQSGAPYDSEHRLRRSDGVYRWFQSRGFPLRDSNGEIVRWCWLLTDIDDRKRAEEAARASERNLKLIIDTIPTLAWSARPDGSAEFLNQHYLDYMGLSAEQASGWGWTAAIHPDDWTVWQLHGAA
jgi:PAS domain S-box-containing protein